jgi:hypothetical protein
MRRFMTLQDRCKVFGQPERFAGFLPTRGVGKIADKLGSR